MQSIFLLTKLILRCYFFVLHLLFDTLQKEKEKKNSYGGDNTVVKVTTVYDSSRRLKNV